MTATTTPASTDYASAPTHAPSARRWWHPRSGLVRGFAWAAVISNMIITVTGATVRVTGSGLGCTTWPDCQPGSLVPVSRSGLAAFHQIIEFGNRMITFPVVIASLGTFVLILLMRPLRWNLVAIAAIGPIGVAIQAVVGGLSVLAGLRWYVVAPHLVISLILVFAAVVVLVRLRESDRPATPTVPRALHLLSYGMVAALGAVAVIGTLVTASGPHAGDARTPRLAVLNVRDWSQLHADLVFLFLGLLIALTVGFVAVHAPRKLLFRTGILIALTLAQGAIGYTQYYLGVPAALVIAHVAGVITLVAVAASVVMATRTRDDRVNEATNPPSRSGESVADV